MNFSSIFHREKLDEYKINLKNEEKPLKIIKRIKTEEGYKFVKDEVYDISQTDAIKHKEKVYSKEYVETMLKGMCARRGIPFIENSSIENIQNIICDIRDNSRAGNFLKYNVDDYAKQTTVEVDATVFAVTKILNINTKNYNLKDICKWGIDKDSRTLKESLKYMQKFTNYFIKDFQTQEKIQKIENEINE